MDRAEALQVLNDSPRAHTNTTATQETPCDYEHPAFPGLFREEMARIADLRSAQFPAESVKPDGAEYVVRLVSVKRMQAVERLISLDENWDPYRQGIGLEPGSKPTNREESWYTAFIAHYLFACAGGVNSERSNLCRHESYSPGQGRQGVGNDHVLSQHRRRETADLASRRKVRVPLHPQSQSVSDHIYCESDGPF